MSHRNTMFKPAQKKGLQRAKCACQFEESTRYTRSSLQFFRHWINLFIKHRDLKRITRLSLHVICYRYLVVSTSLSPSILRELILVMCGHSSRMSHLCHWTRSMENFQICYHIIELRFLKVFVPTLFGSYTYFFLLFCPHTTCQPWHFFPLSTSFFSRFEITNFSCQEGAFLRSSATVS